MAPYSFLCVFKSSALAMADLRVLATNRAPLRGTTASTAWACSAGKPWIWRTTSRIFCADMRMFLVMAWTSISLLGFRLRRVGAVFLERARRGKLSEPMADHVFGHEHRVKDFAVMHVEGQPDKIGCDHRAPRPGLDRRLVLGVFGLLDFLHQVAIDKRSFFNRASHSSSLYVFHRPAITADQDEPVRMFLLVPGAIAFGEQAPGRSELLPAATGLGLAGAATVQIGRAHV